MRKRLRRTWASPAACRASSAVLHRRGDEAAPQHVIEAPALGAAELPGGPGEGPGGGASGGEGLVHLLQKGPGGGEGLLQVQDAPGQGGVLRLQGPAGVLVLEPGGHRLPALLLQPLLLPAQHGLEDGLEAHALQGVHVGLLFGQHLSQGGLPFPQLLRLTGQVLPPGPQPLLPAQALPQLLQLPLQRFPVRHAAPRSPLCFSP